MRAFLVFLSILVPAAWGQVTVSEPIDSTGDFDGSRVVPSSAIGGAVAAGPAVLQSAQASRSQIQIKTTILYVDEATRQRIYDQAPDQLVPTASMLPQLAKSDLAMWEASSPNSSRRSTRSPSFVASTVLDQDLVAVITGQVAQSDASEARRTPTLTLADGKQGEMNDIAERPFIVGVDSKSGQPVVESMREGTTTRILVRRTSDGANHLIVQLLSTSIDVGKQITLMRKETKPMTIQRPSEHETSVIAAAVVQDDASLLVDPFVSRTVQVNVEKAAPVLGRIPLLGKSFTESETVDVTQAALYLFTPTSLATQR